MVSKSWLSQKYVRIMLWHSMYIITVITKALQKQVTLINITVTEVASSAVLKRSSSVE